MTMKATRYMTPHQVRTAATMNSEIFWSNRTVRPTPTLVVEARRGVHLCLPRTQIYIFTLACAHAPSLECPSYIPNKNMLRLISVEYGFKSPQIIQQHEQELAGCEIRNGQGTRTVLASCLH